MSPSVKLASLLLFMASVVACNSDVPCLTKGQTRTSSGCVCPEGTRFVEDLENQTSECVQEGRDADVDFVRAGDGGMKDSGDLSAKPDAGPSRQDAGVDEPEPRPSRLDAGSAERDGEMSQPGPDADGNAADGGRGAPAACVPEAEGCNGKDDDCDGEIDEGLKNACGAACGMAVPPEDCATPGDDNCDGTKNEGCAPPPPSCVPRAETCDGTDEDCDGVPDDGVLNACKKCGSVPVETCNGQDDDCDGAIDEGVKVRCWRDSDRDGYAAAGAVVTESCECGMGQTSQEPTSGKSDCADADGKVKPGIAENCSTPADDNCSGQANEGCAPPKPACVPSTEKCDGEDNNCDGKIDNGVNECGMPCGTACPPPGFCGDGKVGPGEECDPLSERRAPFFCSATCARISKYTPCQNRGGPDPACLAGTSCNPNGICSNVCSTISDCDSVTGFPNIDVQCPVPRGTMCVMRCLDDADCAPGAICNGGAICEGAP